MPRISPTDYKVQVKIYKKLGFEHVRTKGDHMVFRKKGHPYRLVLPKWKEIPVFIINNNLESAGISKSEYLELLLRPETPRRRL